MSNLDTVVIMAARYAHTRRTGAALAVVRFAIEHWDELSEHAQNQLVEESTQEATCNLNDWQRLARHWGSVDPTRSI